MRPDPVQVLPADDPALPLPEYAVVVGAAVATLVEVYTEELLGPAWPRAVLSFDLDGPRYLLYG